MSPRTLLTITVKPLCTKLSSDLPKILSDPTTSTVLNPVAVSVVDSQEAAMLLVLVTFSLDCRLLLDVFSHNSMSQSTSTISMMVAPSSQQCTVLSFQW